MSRLAWTLGALALVLVAGVATVAVVLVDQARPPAAGDLPASPQVDAAALLARLAAEGYNVTLDSDADGLPDALENFLHGSDPHRFSTTGNGIPDGWFVRHGFDPTRPGIEAELAAEPPASSLPQAFAATWRDDFRWTLADAYAAGRPVDWPANVTWDNGLDPKDWRGPGGLPIGWLLHYGLPLDRDTSAEIGEGGVSVGEAFAQDLDPRKADADADGLADTLERSRHGTDPHRQSTTGAGVPDGWLVRFGLDPLDRNLASRQLAGKGMSVRDTWVYDRDRFGAPAALAGQGLDPTRMESRGDGIPDGWLVGMDLDPLDAGIGANVTQCSSVFPGARPEAAEAAQLLGADRCLTVLDEYGYLRPSTWDEASAGPWLGGLDPREPDDDSDGLPDAVEMRGWTVERRLQVGPPAPGPGSLVAVSSDPRRPDTDGDGLLDAEEYAGSAERDGQRYSFSPSDPQSTDTAFSGLTDAEKVFGTWAGKPLGPEVFVRESDGSLRSLLDPAKADSAGSHLRDEQYLAYWLSASEAAGRGEAYNGADRYPGSNTTTYNAWLKARFGREFSNTEAAAILGPGGQLRPGLANLVNPTPDGSSLPAGFKLDPGLLVLAKDLPQLDARAADRRSPIDPANPDTDGDGLRDSWELGYGVLRTTDPTYLDLDPARHASDGRQPDGAISFLSDNVVWRASQPDGPDLVGTYRFTNLEKQKAGTDPHVLDANGDGVADSWVYFWKAVYPDHRPQAPYVSPTSDEMAAMQAALDLSDPPKAPDLRDVEKARAHFIRFSTSNTPRDGETKTDEFDDVTVTDATGLQTKATVYAFEGDAPESLADDAKAGLNPYLLDSDDNGIPDAWAVIHAKRSAGTANPCAATAFADLVRRIGDADADADADGLPHADEFLAGTDPCLADTRGDGVTDADAWAAGYPLTPGGTAGDGEAFRDSDFDGLKDTEERAAGTDPNRPDTKASGLLDGQRDICWDTVADPQGRLWLELGIAHDACPGKPAPFAEFLGSPLSKRPQPSKQDSNGDGIPDGWALYYGLSANGAPSASLTSAYLCARPGWWDESRLGPWWWGTRPQTGAQTPECARDRDRDGLDDLNGEDPVPAADPANGAANVEGDAPRLPEALTSGALDRTALLKLGQSFGKCAGDPAACATQWAARPGPGSPPALTIGSAPAPSAAILKEVPFSVSGQLNCVGGCPAGTLADRTVVVRAGGGTGYRVGDGSVLGVGFSRPDGSFTVQACLCKASSSVDLDQGQVALGLAHGSVDWTPNVQAYAVNSSLQLMVHVYASGQGAGEGPASSVLGSHKVATPSATLTIDAPDVKWNAGKPRALPVTLTLTDASGVPVPNHRVSLHGAGPGIAASERTGPNGQWQREFALSDDALGELVLTAQAASGDGVPAGTSATATSILQRPLALAIEAPDLARIGVDYKVSVAATSNGVPVADTPVVVVQTMLRSDGLSQLFPPTPVDDGIAVATIRVGPGLLPGEATIEAQVPASAYYEAATQTKQVAVAMGSFLDVVVPAEAQSGHPIHVTGTLRTPDGAGIEGVRVRALFDERAWATFQTGPSGSLAGDIVVPSNASAGPHTLRWTFGGLDGIDASEATTSLRVLLSTRLSLDPAHASPGQDFEVTGRLQDGQGTPLARQPILVQATDRAEPSGTTTDDAAATLVEAGTPARGLITADDGSFRARFKVPPGAALGDRPITAWFGGTHDGTYGQSMARMAVTVGTATHFEVDPDGVFRRGDNALTGRLVQAADGGGSAGATVHLSVAGLPDQDAVTDVSGGFGFTVRIEDDRAGGPVHLSLDYGGDDEHGAAHLDVDVPFRAPSHLSIVSPGETGRGQPFAVDLLLRDDRGEPVRGLVTASFLGMPAQTTTSTNGSGQLTWPVADDAPIGTHDLLLSFAGDEGASPTTASRRIVVKEGVDLVLGGLPESIQPGAPVVVTATLTDRTGTPLAGRLVSFRLLGQAHAILVETDGDGRAKAAFSAPGEGRFEVVAAFAGATDLAPRTVGQVVEVKAPGAASWLWAWALAAAVLLAAGVAVAIVLRRRRARDPVAVALRTAERTLRAGDAWSAGVLLAYRTLVEHAGRRGMVDSGHLSMRDFVADLVAATGIPEPLAVDFVRLAETARYSQAPLGPGDALRARSVLRAMLRHMPGGLA